MNQVLPPKPSQRVGDPTGSGTGYPWQPGDQLFAADLNYAFENAVHISTGALQTSGGTMTGPLNWTATGATASRAAQDRSADAYNLKDFDATNGANYSPALNAAITALSAGTGGKLVLPAGSLTCASAIVANIPAGVSITIEGMGVDASILNFANANDGLSFKLLNAGSNWGSIVLLGFTVMRGPTSPAQANTGINIYTDPGVSTMYGGVSYMRDIQVLGSGTRGTATNQWLNGIVVSGVSGCVLDNVVVLGLNGIASDRGDVGITLQGSAHPQYAASCMMVNCTIVGNSCGLSLGCWMQGIFVANSTIIGQYYSVRTAPITGGALPEDFAIVNSTLNATYRGIYISGLNQCRINGNTILNFNRGGAFAGVEINQSAFNSIIGNNIIGGNVPGETGILASACSVAPNVIVGNMMGNWGGTGVYLSGNTTGATVIGNSSPSGPRMVQQDTGINTVGVNTFQSKATALNTTQPMYFYNPTSGFARWFVGNDQSTESGGNTGNDFQIVAVADAGTPLLGATMKTSRSTGATTFASVQGRDLSVNLNGPAGTNRALTYQTSGVPRWYLTTNNTAESGSNAGSDFVIAAVNDGNTTSTAALSINRATQAVTIPGPLNYTATGATRSWSAQDRAAQIIDIQDYGQLGVNPATDTATMLAAVAALPADGGTLLLRTNNNQGITLNQTITITKSCKLQGMTANGACSTIVCMMTGPAIQFSNPVGTNQLTFEAENLRFIAVGTAATRAAIQVTVGPSPSSFFPTFQGRNITITRNVASAAAPYASTFTNGIEFLPSSLTSGQHNFWNCSLENITVIGATDTSTGKPIVGTTGIAFGQMIAASMHNLNVTGVASGLLQTDYCEEIVCLSSQFLGVTKGWTQSTFAPVGASQVKILQAMFSKSHISGDTPIDLDCVMTSAFEGNFLICNGTTVINLTNPQSSLIQNNTSSGGTNGCVLTKGSYNEGGNVISSNVFGLVTTHVSLGAGTVYDTVMDNLPSPGSTVSIVNNGANNFVRSFQSNSMTLSGGLTVSGLATMNGGESFGAQVGASNVDLSKHITLNTAGYGFSVTASRLNYVASGPAAHVFNSNATDCVSINNAALISLVPARFNSTVGFNNTAPVAKPTVTGSKGANAALGSLLTALAAYGLITDSSTA